MKAFCIKYLLRGRISGIISGHARNSLQEPHMLSILGRRVRLCDRITRREMLRIGGLAFTGLMWSDLLRMRANGSAGASPSPSPRRPRSTFGRAKSCIVIFNYGGPSHIDTFDLKPDAPAEIRGEFQPIATSVPG